jgi:hypothetical protein
LCLISADGILTRCLRRDPDLLAVIVKPTAKQNFSRFKTMIKANITLTETEKDDLNAFFQFQLDKEANYLAAFTSKDPSDKTAYIEKYINI